MSARMQADQCLLSWCSCSLCVRIDTAARSSRSSGGRDRRRHSMCMRRLSEGRHGVHPGQQPGGNHEGARVEAHDAVAPGRLSCSRVWRKAQPHARGPAAQVTRWHLIGSIRDDSPGTLSKFWRRDTGGGLSGSWRTAPARRCGVGSKPRPDSGGIITDCCRGAGTITKGSTFEEEEHGRF